MQLSTEASTVFAPVIGPPPAELPGVVQRLLGHFDGTRTIDQVGELAQLPTIKVVAVARKLFAMGVLNPSTVDEPARETPAREAPSQAQQPTRQPKTRRRGRKRRSKGGRRRKAQERTAAKPQRASSGAGRPHAVAGTPVKTTTPAGHRRPSSQRRPPASPPRRWRSSAPRSPRSTSATSPSPPWPTVCAACCGATERLGPLYSSNTMIADSRVVCGSVAAEAAAALVSVSGSPVVCSERAL